MSQEIPRIEERERVANINRKIKNEAIAYLERPVRHMLGEAMDFIERGDYDLIIGIDASGRIPTLISSKVIGYIYEKKVLSLQ